MYIQYWNLRERPFQNVADTRFAFLSDQHREGLARLLYIVEERKLGGVLAGPYGVGKSMILELLAEKVRTQPQTLFVQMDAPPSNTVALARQILLRLGQPGPVTDLAQALGAIQEQLVESHFVPHLVLALDEAQMLREPDAYEFLHLLCNMRVRRRTGNLGENGVTVILSGHQDLINHLSVETSLLQRLQFFWQLEPLSERQTVEYVQHRMRSAGGDIWTFDETALQAIYQTTQGLPRLINNLCDVALLLGCAGGLPRIAGELVQQAAREMQNPFTPATRPTTEAPV